MTAPLTNATFSYFQFTNDTTGYLPGGESATLFTANNQTLNNVTFVHDLFAFEGSVAPSSDYSLVNFAGITVTGTNGLKFVDTVFNSGDPNGAGPSGSSVWMQGTGGPITFDGVMNEGHYTVGTHKFGSQINIGFGTGVTVENSSTDDGGNFYLSGMNGLTVDNNLFVGSGFAINGVQNACVYSNTFDNISNAFDASGGGENRAIVLKNAWGTPGDANIKIYDNKFTNLSIPAVLLNQFTDPNTADPVTPDASNYSNVSVYDNDFSGVASGVDAVENAYDTVTINAANNWWGSLHGPTTAANPGGDGVDVGDNVTFTPWIGVYTDTTPHGDPGFTPTGITRYAVPTQLVFITEPSATARHGVPFATQPVVEAEDAFGNLGINFDSNTVPGSAVELTLAPNLYTGTLDGTNPVSANGGIVSFSGLSISQSGIYSLVASALGSAWTGATAIADGTSTAISIAQEATTTTLSSTSDNPSAYGESISITATVATVNSGVATPTGSVTFFDGTQEIAVIALASGQATLTTSTLTVGDHSITAEYSGDASDESSDSTAYSQTVNQDITTTALTAAPNPSVYGQTVTLTATVSVTAPGVNTPTGAVTFWDGMTDLGTGTLSGGVATLTVSTLSVATHSISAEYDGDTNDLGSNSNTVSQVVNKDTTTTTLTAAPNPSVYGQTVTLTATVSVTAPGVNTPTGAVTFWDGMTDLGTGTLSGGVATLMVSTLSVATHSISAEYDGDTNDVGSNSNTVSQVVNQDSTTTTLGSSANPSAFGQSVTFTATVSANSPGINTPTGTVTFLDGMTPIGTGTLSGGVATFSTTSLSVATHSITAAYGGDANDQSSTSSALGQVVVADSTSTALASSVNPSVFGQSVTFTATVSANAPGINTPTGTVTFLDGMTAIGTGTLSGGVATFSTTSLAVATHSITAMYGGDGNDTGSTSTAVNQVVNKDSTTTTLVGSPASPTVYGQPITFTATVAVVSPGVGTPGGVVTFLDGSTSIGTGTLSGGVATLTIGSLSVGSHSITASYGGDTNDVTSSSTALSRSVNKDTTQTTITSTANPSVFGQSVTFTATVIAKAPGVNTPTGVVIFRDGSTPVGSSTLDASGHATLTLSTLSVGTHHLTAGYAGDAQDIASSSTTFNQVVNQDSTTTTLVSAPNPSLYGQSVTYTATVAAVSPGVGTPTGTVTFMDGATALGRGTLSGGVATLSFSTSAVGSHSITAVYGGDTNDATSTSSPVTQVVQATTTTALTAAPNPSVYGQTVTLTATVTPESVPGAVTPTGTVTFLDGSTPLGTVTLNGSGVATLNVSSLSVNTHSLTASYAGDTYDVSSASSATSQVVNKDSTSTALTSSANPSVFGQSVTFTATVTANSPGVNTPTGTVTFLDGMTSIGTGTLSGGVATLTTSGFSVSTHAISVVYGGDGNDTGNTSNTVSQVVNPANTTTSLVAAPNPSVFGQTVTLTATVSVTAPGVSTPTGTVTFMDGMVSLGTATLNGSGVASIQTSGLSVNTHALTAIYSGDTDDATSTSNTVSQVVNPASTTTSLVAAPNPSVFGQTVTLTATVSVTAPGVSTPTGTVTFMDGATSLGTATLNGAGVASIQTSGLSVNTHSLTAVYSGDTDDAGSTSTAVSQVVNKDATSTALVAAPNPSVYGQSVTLTATISVSSPGASTPSGTVTFFDGMTSLGSAPVNGSGVASISTSGLSVNTHSLTAVYSGDGNELGSSSTAVSQVVNKDTTTTTLVAAPNPSQYGQTVTLTATVGVAAPGAGTPGGTVTFLDGMTPIGTGTLTGGVATFSLPSLAVGTHAITASYGGDTNDLTSSSSPVNQVVQDTTATAIASSVNPSVYGQGVTFTATVTAASVPGAVTPTGTVTFWDGSTELGTGILNGVGATTITVSTLSVDDHMITAVYGGDTYDLGSSSDPLDQTVNQDDTTTTLSSSAAPSFFGEPVTLTATVTVQAPGAGTPTGQVYFLDGADILGFADLDGNGHASITLYGLPVGDYSIDALYFGDDNSMSSSSDPFDQVVNPDITTTSLVAAPNPSTYGQSVTLTATVTANAPGVNTPGGTVTFMDGMTSLGTVTLDGTGTATLSLSTLAVGSHPITAVYSGDTNDQASNSSAVTQVVQETTTTVLTSSANPSAYGQSVTFTATVTPESVPGAVTPTGTVTFYNGMTELGTGTLNGSGVATFSTGALAVGTESITASYPGDTYNLTSTSNAVSQVVHKDDTTTALVASPNPSVFGQSVTLTATVTANSPGVNTPGGAVTFYCGSTQIGTATLNASGVASISTSSLAVGTRSLSAVYAGDGNDNGSSSNTYSQVVNQDATTTTLASSLNPSQLGIQAVTFTATITVTSPGVGTPTGTVTFYDNGTAIGTGTVSTSAGVTTATYTTSSLSLGSHPITATYTGDTNDQASSSNTVSQSVISLNTPPTAFSQSLTLGTTGVTSVTLQGTDAQTPASQLVFTVTSLPALGTLYDSNGNPVTLNETFVGSADTLTYLLPTLVLGSLSTSFTYTATDNGYPAGSGFNPLTSGPATATIQTPSGSTNVLRVSGTLNADTFSLSKSNDNTSLVVSVNGATPTSYTLSSLSQVFVYGDGGNDAFTVGSGLTSVPLTIYSGNGNTSLTASASSITFNGGTGTNSATLTTSGHGDTATLAPVNSTLSGTGYTIKLNSVANITVNGGSNDIAKMSDISGSNTFTATPTSATFAGTGFSDTANHFGTVYGTAATGTTDTATLSDSSGSNRFVAAQTSANFSGTGFYNQANNFSSVVGKAAAGTTDSATFSDTSGSNTFTATPTTATFSGGSFSNTGNGFITVIANSGSGTTDTATLYDSTGNDTFTAAPTFATMQGPGYSTRANSFASVTGISSAGGTDSAHLSDTSGSNTLTATATTATFSGSGFSETATGFGSVYGTAASNTTDKATLSDSSGSNRFTGTPTYGLFSGTTFYNKASGFVSVIARAASGTSDMATLSDTSGSNTFTASQTAATFSGSGFSNSANGFLSVIANATAGTTDAATLSDSSGSNRFIATPGAATFSGTGFSNQAAGFTSVLAKAASGTTDTATLTDTSGSNTFTATPTLATFSGSGFSNSANGFSSVVANATSGTTDTATLFDSTGNDTFSATPTFGTMTGPGYSNRANFFSSVKGISNAGGTDSAHLSDTSGSNTFTATQTTATFSGSGFSETATGFSAMYGTAASGTTDTATLSDTSGSNTFTATPNTGQFSGTGFFNRAAGFASVTAIAGSGTTDTASLSDASGSNTFTATPTSSTFSGGGFSETAKGFTKVIATAASGTTDTASLSDTVSQPGTFTASPTSASMVGTGYNNIATGFASVQATIVNQTDIANLSDGPSGAQFTGSGNQGTLVGTGSTYSIAVTMATNSTMNLTGSTGSNLVRITSAIDYLLNKIGNWLSD